MTKKNNRKNTQRAQKRAEKTRKRQARKQTHPKQSNGNTHPKQHRQKVTQFGGYIDNYNPHAEEIIAQYGNFTVNPFSTHDWKAPVIVTGDNEFEMFELMKRAAPMCPEDGHYWVLFEIRNDTLPVERIYEMGQMIETGMTPLDQSVFQISTSAGEITQLAFFYHDGTMDSVWRGLSYVLQAIHTGKCISVPERTGVEAFVLAAYFNFVAPYLPDKFYAKPLLDVLQGWDIVELDESDENLTPIEILKKHDVIGEKPHAFQF